MNSELLQPFLEKIGNLTVELVHEDFLKIWIRYRRFGGLNELFIVYRPSARLGCYKGAVDESGEIMAALKELWSKFVETEESPWTSTTLILEADGQFTIDFGYENLERTDFAEWHAAWESKHLGKLKFKK